VDAVFKALGDRSRLEIISLLAKSNTLCVNVIADKMGMSQPAVSQHLKVLKGAGILDAQKMGLYVHYSINKEKMKEYEIYFDNLFNENLCSSCAECNGKINKKRK
jgi:ArsR family transcriptional regulator, arsenate/arsenite/antimonite-responsive transcriptional repressor